jgi:hypothetical protein
MRFVQHRVADERILRLIQKWLKAGVSEDGEWSETKVGTPQGAVISPLLAKFRLELHPDKTRLIEFGGFAQANRRARAEGEPDTFTFLGFTHRRGNNSGGHFVIRRRTVRKRLEAKLQQVKQTLRKRMHEPAPKVGEWLGRVVNGFYQYHAVPGNRGSLQRFRERIGWYWRHVLERRSQKGRLSAARLGRLLDRWLPRPGWCIRILRSVSTPSIRGRSRMR